MDVRGHVHVTHFPSLRSIVKRNQKLIRGPQERMFWQLWAKPLTSFPRVEKGPLGASGWEEAA